MDNKNKIYNLIFSENDILLEMIVLNPEQYDVQDIKEAVEKSYRQMESRQGRFIRKGYSTEQVEQISKLIDNKILYITENNLIHYQNGFKQSTLPIPDIRKNIDEIIKNASASERIFIAPELLKPNEYLASHSYV